MALVEMEWKDVACWYYHIILKGCAKTHLSKWTKSDLNLRRCQFVWKTSILQHSSLSHLLPTRNFYHHPIVEETFENNCQLSYGDKNHFDIQSIKSSLILLTSLLKTIANWVVVLPYMQFPRVAIQWIKSSLIMDPASCTGYHHPC